MAIGDCSSFCCIPVWYLLESVVRLNVGSSRFSFSLTSERKIKTCFYQVKWNVSLNDNCSKQHFKPTTLKPANKSQLLTLVMSVKKNEWRFYIYNLNLWTSRSYLTVLKMFLSKIPQNSSLLQTACIEFAF